MKTLFPLCFVVLLFACSDPNLNLDLEEIKLTKQGGEADVVVDLNSLKNEKDTSKRLSITYSFNKSNVNSINSGFLQIDKDACFRLSINKKLILERTPGSFFQDTLLSAKSDSFLSKNIYLKTTHF